MAPRSNALDKELDDLEGRDDPPENDFDDDQDDHQDEPRKSKDSDPKDDDLDIEIEDDTPPQDRGRPRRKEGEEPDIPDDDEMSNYSERVQKRMKDLRREFHEERRRAEEREREAQSAAEMLRRALEENQRLKSTLTSGEKALVEQAKNRIEAQLQQARREYGEAYDSGDAGKLAEAQEKISGLLIEKDKVVSYRPRPEPQPQQQPQRPAQPRAPDPKAEQWRQKNPWFGRDRALTGYAFGIHEQLIMEEGVDPRSDRYYQLLDERIRKAFPNSFRAPENKEEPARRRPPVAGVDRDSRPSKKVTLTQSEVRLAKRLGISLKEYAEEKRALAARKARGE